MDDWKKLLHAAGLATTGQRVLILSNLRDRKDHPDAEAVYAAVHELLPSISLDTVYRALSLFTRKELIQQIAVPTRRSRFDGCVAPHDHFLCTRCERIVDIMPSDSAPAPVSEAIRKIGVVQSSQRTYLGICESCAQPEAVCAGL